MREEPDRKESKKLTFKTFKNGQFWQQNITPHRKCFLTQSKHVLNKWNVLQSRWSLVISGEITGFYFGHGL